VKAPASPAREEMPARPITIAIGGTPSAWAMRRAWIDDQRPAGVNDDAWYRTLKFLMHNLDARLPVRLKFDALPNGEVSARIAYKVWTYITDGATERDQVVADGELNA